MTKGLERAVRSLEYETSWYSNVVQVIGCELSSKNMQEGLQPVGFDLCWEKAGGLKILSGSSNPSRAVSKAEFVLSTSQHGWRGCGKSRLSCHPE
jgi:hypothetical protein